MRKILFGFIGFLLIPFFAYSQINTYGTYYNNFAIMQKNGEWQYYDLNLFYLKLRRPSEGDFELESNLSFSLIIQPGMDGREEFDIQRLNFQTSLMNIHLTLGRFLPQYHYTNFFQPLNVFLGPQFFKKDIIYKGIDGIMLRKFLSPMTSMEYVWKSEAELSSSSHLVNLTSHLGSFDYSIICLYRGIEHEFLPGFGFKGDLEISLFNETLLRIDDNDEGVDLTSSTGIDYSFGQFMIMVEYLYNGGDSYISPREGLSLRDKHYLFLNTFYFEPMVKNIGGSFILNLDDHSSIVSTYYETELMHGVNFLAGIYVPLSKDAVDEFSSDRIGSFILNCYLKTKF